MDDIVTKEEDMTAHLKGEEEDDEEDDNYE
jgi:hypothetical protein